MRFGGRDAILIGVVVNTGGKWNARFETGYGKDVLRSAGKWSCSDDACFLSHCTNSNLEIWEIWDFRKCFERSIRGLLRFIGIIDDLVLCFRWLLLMAVHISNSPIRHPT